MHDAVSVSVTKSLGSASITKSLGSASKSSASFTSLVQIQSCDSDVSWLRQCYYISESSPMTN